MLRLSTAFVAALLCATTALAQTTEIRPVEFVVTGNVSEEGSGTPIERARVIVERSDDGTVLADRVFTDANGDYVAVFETEAEVTVGIDEPTGGGPRESWTDGYWMGSIGPNPVHGGSDVRLTVPYAARDAGEADPELELYDLRGRRIDTRETLGSGVYLYRLRFDDRAIEARKMLVLGPTRARFEVVRVSGPEAATGTTDALARRVDDAVAPIRVTIERAGYVPASTDLQVDSGTGGVFDATLPVETPPVADLTVGGTQTAGEGVLFDATASQSPDGQPLDHAWNFGDGQRGGGAEVAHVYAAEGTYDVTLVVTSTHGAADTATTQITIAAPAPPATVDAELVGSITDVPGNLLADVRATIVGTAVTDSSDTDGTVTLTGVPTGTPLAIRLEKDGYTDQVVRLTLPADTDFGTFESTLARRDSPLSIARVEDGGVHRGAEGATVELPVDGLVHADGSPVTGDATLSVTPLDMSDERDSFAFPGGYEGLRPTGERGLILSYGVMEVVFEQDGEELQLAPGRTATVEIPVFTPGAAVGDTIALWSVDPSTGLWREEGSGEVVASDDAPSGLALRAEVTHFSWWNADKFEGDPYRVIPECRIRDQDGLPTLEIPPGESCYINGQTVGPGGPVGNPSTNIGPNNAQILAIPSRTDFTLNASTSNGTLRGTLVVNGEPGATDNVEIVLDPVDPGGGTLTFPSEVTGAIDPADETDVYTFELSEGQQVAAAATVPDNSTLWGRLRLLDPTSAAVDSADFREDNPGSVVWTAESAGTYTLEVESTNDQIGGYDLRVFLVEDRPITLGNGVEVDAVPGAVQTFELEAEAGTWLSVDQRRLEGISGGRGSVTFRRPDGSVYRELPFSFSGNNLGLVQLDATGTWKVVVRITDVTGVLFLLLNDVPEIGYDETRSGSLESRTTQYYRTPAGVGDAVRAGLDRGDGFLGNVSIKRADFGGLEFGPGLSEGSDSATRVLRADEPGPVFVRVRANFSSSERDRRDYRVILHRQRAPGDPIFDAAGRAQFVDTVDRFAQLNLHRFEAQAGDGVVVRLEPAGATPLDTRASFKLYRVGNGDGVIPRTSFDSERSNAGDANLDLLELGVFEIDTTDTYVLAVGGTDGAVGDMQVTIDVVRAAPTITVDDDLAECPGATTRSLLAALAAAPESGTVEICAGTYAAATSFNVRNAGLTVEGAGEAATVITRLGRNTVFFAPNGLTAMRDLTVETRAGQSSNAVFVNNGPGASYERLTIRPADATGNMNVALELGFSDGALVQDCTILDSTRSLEITVSDDVIFADNTVRGGLAILDVDSGNGAVIRDNVMDVDENGTAVLINSGAGHQILDNSITVLTGDFGARADSEAMRIQDDDSAGDRGPTVVRGNRITTNEAGLRLEVRREGSAIVCEQNVVEMTTTQGHRALHALGSSLGPDQSVLVRNNVFSGVRLFEGVLVQSTPRMGAVDIVNNSFSIAPGTNTQSGYVFFLIDEFETQPGQRDLRLVNNVVDGIGAGIAIETPADVTVVSDHNVFGDFATYGAGGMAGNLGPDDLTGVDPLFDTDLLLQPGSPAIDSGATAADFAAVPAVDVLGTARPQGAGVDRGAFEQ